MSNTAFRGFGSPEGALVIEDAVERLARLLGNTQPQSSHLLVAGGLVGEVR